MSGTGFESRGLGVHSGVGDWICKMATSRVIEAKGGTGWFVWAVTERGMPPSSHTHTLRKHSHNWRHQCALGVRAEASRHTGVGGDQLHYIQLSGMYGLAGLAVARTAEESGLQACHYRDRNDGSPTVASPPSDDSTTPRRTPTNPLCSNLSPVPWKDPPKVT